jgi:hypothetical protein
MMRTGHFDKHGARVAVVVSPHGLGHAARASAVVQVMADCRPDLEFHIVTTVPKWFFADSLRCSFKLQRLITDVGLVQHNALEEDLEATLRRLDELSKPSSGVVDRLARRIDRLRCSVVICDISPLGIEAAARCGRPSVLVENFTWDWIYRGYRDAPPGLMAHADRLERLVELADLHIQTRPRCLPSARAEVVGPVARATRTAPDRVRRRLGVPDGMAMVLLTMGGMSWQYETLSRLSKHRRAHFVVPGGGRDARREAGLTVLPFRSDQYHPDLVGASDVVVGKLGYSTVAETYGSGAAMVFISRERFRESRVLAEFVRGMTEAEEITSEAFDDGSWLEVLTGLLDRPRRRARNADGAGEAARLILDRYDAQLQP